MHVKSGDLVKVIAGADKGKTGKVVSVNTKTGEVFLEGVNVKVINCEYNVIKAHRQRIHLVSVFNQLIKFKSILQTKHVKPSGDGEAGQIVKKEFPVHHSNVQHFSEKSQVVSRVGKKVDESGKKVRYLIKTGEVLAN